MNISRRLAIAGGLAALVASARAEARVGTVLPLHANEYGHSIVPVSINDATCQALLDNGLSRTLMDLGFAGQQSLLSGQTSLVNGGEAKRSVKVRLSMGWLKGATDTALVDLSDLSSGASEPVRLVVGRDLLGNVIATLDHDAGVLRLATVDQAFEPPAGAKRFGLTPMPRAGHTMDVEIEGERVKAYVDLGASFPLMVRESPHVTRWREDGRRWSTMASATARGGDMVTGVNPVTRLKSLRLGPHGLNDVPAEIYRPDERVFGNYVAVVGAPVLSKFLMSLDVSGSRMWLKPNSKYGAGYLEPAVGVGTRAEGGWLRVIHVAANSPAEAAGMKAGDEIIAINGAPPQRSAIGDTRPGDVLALTLASGQTRKVTAALYY